MTYKAEMSQRQTAEAADPQDLVVFQVKMSETAALLQTTDLTETVVWEGGHVKTNKQGQVAFGTIASFLCQERRHEDK